MIYSIVGIVFGVLFAFVWKAKDYIQLKTFSWRIWWMENKMRFMWAFSFAVIIGVMVNVYPTSLDALAFVGFNIDSGEDNLSEILIGLFIANATYTKSKSVEDKS